MSRIFRWNILRGYDVVILTYNPQNLGISLPVHVFQQLYCKIINQHHLTHGLHTNLFLELQTTSFLWLFQLDDSKSLHKNWLFHHFHPLKYACLGYQVGDDSASIFMENPSIRSLSIEIFFFIVKIDRTLHMQIQVGDFPDDIQHRQWTFSLPFFNHRLRDMATETFSVLKVRRETNGILWL